MRSKFILLLFCLLNNYGHSQLFNITIPLNSFEAFSGIVIQDDTIYANGFSYTSTRNVMFSKVTLQGDTIFNISYSTPLVNYYLGFNSLLPFQDKLLSFGCYSDTSGIRRPWFGIFDKNGNMVYEKKFTDYNYQYVFNGATIDGDYFVFSGLTDSIGIGDVFILKCDTLGNTIWQNTYGGGLRDEAYNIDKTTDGGFITGGFTKSFGSGNSDGHLVKFDSLGNYQWQKMFGGTEGEGATATVLSNGDIIVVSGNNPPGPDETDTWVYRLDSAGNELWNKVYSLHPTLIDGLYAPVELSDGSLIYYGSGKDPIDDIYVGWLLKSNGSGDILWQRTFRKRNTANYFESLDTLSDGGFVIAGYVFPEGTLTEDAWLIRTDSLGCDTIGPCSYVGVEELLNVDVGLLIYPNPNEGRFVVEITNTAAATVAGGGNSGSGREMQILLTDILGRSILNEKINDGVQKLEIDISKENAGIYFVHWVSEDRIICSKKIIYAK